MSWLVTTRTLHSCYNENGYTYINAGNDDDGTSYFDLTEDYDAVQCSKFDNVYTILGPYDVYILLRNLYGCNGALSSKVLRDDSKPSYWD